MKCKFCGAETEKPFGLSSFVVCPECAKGVLNECNKKWKGEKATNANLMLDVFMAIGEFMKDKS